MGVTKTNISNAKQIIWQKFQKILLFNFVTTTKPKKNSVRPNSFWELCSRVPPLFPALLKNKELNGEHMLWEKTITKARDREANDGESDGRLRQRGGGSNADGARKTWRAKKYSLSWENWGAPQRDMLEHKKEKMVAS